MPWLLPSPVVWQLNVTQRVSCTHIILSRSRIKYVFCSFWNLALCQILPCTLPIPLPTPLCFGFHCLWYNITSTNTFMDSSQFKQFYWCRNPPTFRKSLTNYITKCCIEYTSPCAGFELTTPAVVIVTDCTGSCKSNYNVITTTTARNIDIFIGISIFLLCCTQQKYKCMYISN
jgi:hypothetical protein